MYSQQRGNSKEVDLIIFMIKSCSKEEDLTPVYPSLIMNNWECLWSCISLPKELNATLRTKSYVGIILMSYSWANSRFLEPTIEATIWGWALRLTTSHVV